MESNKDKNPFEGVTHADLTDDEKKARGIETDAERDERMSKPKTSNDKSKKTAAKKGGKAKLPKASKAPKAKRAAKPKKASTSDRAPRIVLSEKQLSESRVVIRVLPAVHKMIERFAKYKDLEINAAADKMITVAEGRLNALHRYNEG